MIYGSGNHNLTQTGEHLGLNGSILHQFPVDCNITLFAGIGFDPKRNNSPHFDDTSRFRNVGVRAAAEADQEIKQLRSGRRRVHY